MKILFLPHRPAFLVYGGFFVVIVALSLVASATRDSGGLWIGLLPTSIFACGAFMLCNGVSMLWWLMNPGSPSTLDDPKLVIALLWCAVGQLAAGVLAAYFNHDIAGIAPDAIMMFLRGCGHAVRHVVSGG